MRQYGGHQRFGARPSSGAACTGCRGASDFMGQLAFQSRQAGLRPRTGALRRGDLPPSLTGHEEAQARIIWCPSVFICGEIELSQPSCWLRYRVSHILAGSTTRSNSFGHEPSCNRGSLER